MRQNISSQYILCTEAAGGMWAVTGAHGDSVAMSVTRGREIL